MEFLNSKPQRRAARFLFERFLFVAVLFLACAPLLVALAILAGRAAK